MAVLTDDPYGPSREQRMPSNTILYNLNFWLP